MGRVPFTAALVLACSLCSLTVSAQAIPNVVCQVEDYPVKAVVAWQFPKVLEKVQVVILHDPSGEQEARFDLKHGASLISLRYKGREMLFGQTAGASVSIFSSRKSSDPELSTASQYWAAYSPDQGGSSMGISAVTTGVACDNTSSMRAFAMMEDRGSDNSFQAGPLLGVEAGKISSNFPPGYSTPFSIETNASWVRNPGTGPKFYLKLTQDVVNTGAEASGPLEWYLNLAAPWNAEHGASAPEACTETAPCNSNSAGALAAGRYADSQRTDGVGFVVPTEEWHTDRAYVRPNAEYVVLLYNAVWAAPRRTFAAVLQHSLPAMGSHHFSWYICVGPWEQTREFAAQQPSRKAPLLVSEAELPAFPVRKEAVSIACEGTEFKPQPNQTDEAVVLRDPAGEQTALFDTSQGGALISLKYKGVEHIWGYNGGGLLQMAFHNKMQHGAWDGDYNPTQAGDGSANSVVSGIACHGSSGMDVVTTMLDFNHNNGFYPKALVAVWNGRMNDMVPLSYSSPYVLRTTATWVPNPAGMPKFYLQLKERFIHIADEQIGSFAFDFAAYIPWEFSTRAISPATCPCTSAQTPSLTGGWYSGPERLDGVAIAMPSSNFPGGKINGGFNSDYMWRNRNFHLGANQSVNGIQAKEFVWFVMVGPWSSATSFAQTLK